MNNHHLQLGGASGPRLDGIDGIDVAQLLGDLSEASATSSAVDLFGLCLQAQRVLVHAHSCGTTLPIEAQALSYFHAMSDECRAYVLCMMQSLAEAYPRQRPALTLV